MQHFYKIYLFENGKPSILTFRYGDDALLYHVVPGTAMWCDPSSSLESEVDSSSYQML